MILVNIVITAVVLGDFDYVFEELVFWICLQRGAASRKKCLPMRIASSSVVSITSMIFM